MRRSQHKGAALLLAAAYAAVTTTPCGAQVRLPSVTLPQLPLGKVGQTAGNLDSGLGGDLAQARLLRLRALVQAHRKEIDTDHGGAPVLRGLVLAVAPNDAALARARDEGFEIATDRSFAELDLRVVILHAPTGMSTRAALDRLRKLDPSGMYDFDHLFDAGASAQEPASAATGASIREPSPSAREAGRGVRVGLIDTGIEAGHPVFRGAVIHVWGCEGRTVAADHGTAIASLLVGDAPSFAGVLAGGEVYAADVYCGLPTGGAVDVIVAAIAWLAVQRVGVINISLVGPPNVLLARAIALAQARGNIIVAAVGNDGPAAPPLYPAAYPGVIGVTAVDAHRRVLLEACRGPQVSFAAPGSDMAAAGLHGTYHALRGTSFAAPIVAGLLARKFGAPDAAGFADSIEALAREAVDLGKPGRDEVYGYGLVGSEYRVPLEAARR